jgi:hypothetical protein
MEGKCLVFLSSLKGYLFRGYNQITEIVLPSKCILIHRSAWRFLTFISDADSFVKQKQKIIEQYPKHSDDGV